MPDFVASSGSGEPAPEAGLVHVVDERPLAVDLHDGEPLAVQSLEIGVPGDVHLGELESQLVMQAPEHLPRALAQVTLGRVIEGDGRYG